MPIAIGIREQRRCETTLFLFYIKSTYLCTHLLFVTKKQLYSQKIQ